MFKIILYQITVISLVMIPLTSHAEKSIDLEKDFIQLVEKQISGITSASTVNQKLTLISRLSNYLNTDANQLLKKAKGEQFIKLSYSINTLDSYLDFFKEFKAKDCDYIHSKIIYYFSPKNENPKPQDIPPIAQMALDIHASLCK